MTINFFFQLAILILSVMAHEVAHGAAAYACGDPTAKNQGRLTMNPLRHIDPIGSVILPFLLYITGTGFLFGWAKPVPYNPYNFRNRRLGEFLVSIAGIATNLVLAVVFALLIRSAVTLGLSSAAVEIMAYIVILNITLGIFNLIPVPPLDGSKIIFSLVPYKYERHLVALERYGFYFLIILVIFFGDWLSQAVMAVTRFLL